MCNICKKEITGFSHCAEPFERGECCSQCGTEKVIPERMRCASVGQKANYMNRDIMLEVCDIDLEQGLLSEGKSPYTNIVEAVKTDLELAKKFELGKAQEIEKFNAEKSKIEIILEKMENQATKGAINEEGLFEIEDLEEAISDLEELIEDIETEYYFDNEEDGD